MVLWPPVVLTHIAAKTHECFDNKLLQVGVLREHPRAGARGDWGRELGVEAGEEKDGDSGDGG